MAGFAAFRAGGWKEGWLNPRRLRFWVWVAVALYTLVGFVIVPWIARGMIVDQIHQQLGLDAKLDDVDANPYAMSVRLEGFSLADRNGKAMIAFDEADVNLQLASIVNRAWTFSEFRIVHPSVRIEHDAERGTLNLRDLLPPKKETEPNADSPPPRLIVGHAAIEGGRIAVLDHTGRQDYQTELGPLDLNVVELSTLPDHEGKQRLEVATRFGGRIVWTGQLAFQPLRSDGHVSFFGEQLAPFTAYLPPELKARIDSGVLDLQFDYAMAFQDGGITADVSKLAVKLAQLGIAQTVDGKSELLRVDTLALAGGRVQWPQRSVSLEKVALIAPSVTLSRDAQGQFIWQTLWPTQAAEVGDNSGASAEAGSNEAASPWSVNVANFELTQGRVAFADAAVDPAATLAISNLTTSVDALSLADGAAMPFTVGFDVDAGGHVAANGTAIVSPALRVDAQAKVTDLALTPANPYLLAQTYLQITSGTLGLEGHVAANPDETLAFDGALGVNGLDARREGVESRLTGMKSLAVSGLTLSLAQQRIDVARAELDGAYLRVHISEDRSLNLANLTREGDAAGADAEQEEPQSAPWDVKLARLRVQNADLDFSDESLPIPFSRSISAVTGGIDAFDTTSRAPTQLNLKGEVGQYGGMTMSGTLRVLDPLQNTDIKASFENLDMPAASAYAIRFAGHKVASGRLDLDLHYVLRNGHLEGDHDIVLHDFALGEKVDYPEAMDLPYGLAISLLKDSNGNINVDLPVEGDVKDPKFRIGGVIMHALANLITQIVTSPFRLLGRLVGLGDSDDLKQVLFPPGSAELEPPQREKIAKVADALTMRPNLALTIHGTTNESADAEALRAARVRARIDERVGNADAAGRLQIVEGMVEQGIPGFSVDPMKGAVHDRTGGRCKADARPQCISRRADREIGRGGVAAGGCDHGVGACARKRGEGRAHAEPVA